MHPTILPSSSTQQQSTTEGRVAFIRFGDGQSQRFVRGITPNMRRWSVVYADLSDADMKTLRDWYYLNANGSALTWTPPFDTVAVKVTLKSINISYTNQNGHSISIEAEEVHDQ